MEDKHTVKISSEYIEQLDVNIDVSLFSANSTFNDGFKNPFDQINKPFEEEHDLFHAPTASQLVNMSVKELFDLNAKISRKVMLEMQLKLMPLCE